MRIIKRILAEFLIKTLPSLILSLTLFVGGIVLLISHIPFWSPFLGIPATQIGIVLLVFVFDKLAQTKIAPKSIRFIHCSICGRPFPVIDGSKETICPQCQKKISQELKKQKKWSTLILNLLAGRSITKSIQKSIPLDHPKTKDQKKD